MKRGEGAVEELLRYALEPSEYGQQDEPLPGIFRVLRTPKALPFYVDYARRWSEDELPGG